MQFPSHIRAEVHFHVGFEMWYEPFSELVGSPGFFSVLIDMVSKHKIRKAFRGDVKSRGDDFMMVL